MLKSWLAKLGLGRDAGSDAYSAETKRMETRRTERRTDASEWRDDDSPPKQTGEEPSTGSES
jgi:hypothetical protein